MKKLIPIIVWTVIIAFGVFGFFNWGFWFSWYIIIGAPIIYWSMKYRDKGKQQGGHDVES